VSDRWQEAVRQGKSGVVKPVEGFFLSSLLLLTTATPGIKLRLGAVVEDIPEYTYAPRVPD
jgi:hypothetical protein